jgi:hypothetical protein
MSEFFPVSCHFARRTKWQDCFVLRDVPDDSYFSALGLSFNGYNSNEICELNYSKKIEKVQNLIKVWSRWNLTIYGLLTLIKCYLLSQFVYLIKPLPRQNNKTTALINGLIYKFLWGGGRDKIQRDLINLPKEKGGIGMISFINFMQGLKVKNLSKILDGNFCHPWKNIVINQLRFPDNPPLSLEAGAVKASRKFCKDLVTCLKECKQTVTCCRGKTADFCIWGGGIPGSNSLLWNENLIGRRKFSTLAIL